ncbi:MAG TPA: hypothetical protein DCG75_18850 [Bacteroidales bacterium]|nr:hypothetical protein [Bacteroidales bacterium]
MALVYNIRLWAQSPDMFNYQAVLRDAEGEVLSNQNVEVEIAILYGTATGITIYNETFNTQTNLNGLINLKLGTGISNDNFSLINWAEGPYFLKLTVNGNELGVTQFLTVPYAKYADIAGNTFSGNYNDLINLPSFAGWDKNVADDFNGNYNDLDNLPNFTLWDKNAYDDFSGNYDDLVNAPTFAGWDKNISDDFSGNYNDLDNIPNPIDTSNFISISNPAQGDLAYYDGLSWQVITAGTEDQILTMESGIPVWKDATTGGSTYKIGDLYLGGIIFYVSPDGLHGLIADLDDTSPGEVYSNGNASVGALSFHNGFSNTDAILSIFPTSNAASSCRLKGSEWYLPSVWEMKLLHFAAYEINRILENDGDTATNGLNTNTGVYWTSTEYAANAAFDYSVISGIIINDNKSNSYRVRAIRAF